MGKKIAGLGGTLLAVGSSFIHIVNPNAVPEKYLPVYVALGSLLALFGVHPLANTNAEK
jgi:hypothetical protein